MNQSKLVCLFYLYTLRNQNNGVLTFNSLARLRSKRFSNYYLKPEWLGIFFSQVAISARKIENVFCQQRKFRVGLFCWTRSSSVARLNISWGPRCYDVDRQR